VVHGANILPRAAERRDVRREQLYMHIFVGGEGYMVQSPSGKELTLT